MKFPEWYKVCDKDGTSGCSVCLTLKEICILSCRSDPRISPTGKLGSFDSEQVGLCSFVVVLCKNLISEM
jgi:hypothetical protein